MLYKQPFGGIKGDVTGEFFIIITEKRYFTAIWTVPMAIKYTISLKIRSE